MRYGEMISERINTRRLLFGIPLETADLYSSGTALGNSLAPMVLAYLHRFLHGLRPLRGHAVPVELRGMLNGRRRHPAPQIGICDQPRQCLAQFIVRAGEQASGSIKHIVGVVRLSRNAGKAASRRLTEDLRMALNLARMKKDLRLPHLLA